MSRLSYNGWVTLNIRYHREMHEQNFILKYYVVTQYLILYLFSITE
jgi:hypothetical protein